MPPSKLRDPLTNWAILEQPLKVAGDVVVISMIAGEVATKECVKNNRKKVIKNLLALYSVPYFLGTKFVGILQVMDADPWVKAS